MELKTESMKNMKKTVEKCLDELMKKNDLTPAETKAALDGFKLHDELCCRIEDCEMEEKDIQNGYSGHDVPYRQYHITSYGMPEGAYSERSRGRMSRADGMSNYSGTPHYGIQGWYQNERQMPSMRSYYGEPYYYTPEYSERGRGYSRHSISDRVVSMVEHMMDSAESEYERQELQKYIRAIRSIGMTD